MCLHMMCIFLLFVVCGGSQKLVLMSVSLLIWAKFPSLFLVKLLSVLLALLHRFTLCAILCLFGVHAHELLCFLLRDKAQVSKVLTHLQECMYFTTHPFTGFCSGSCYDGPLSHAHCGHSRETRPLQSGCLYHMFIFAVVSHPSFHPSTYFRLLLSAANICRR